MARLTFLLLLLWVGVAGSAVVDLQKRIYGGKKCDDDKRLYHVALSNKDAVNKILCGGSLIKPQWVLTAAHCEEPTMYAVVKVHPGFEREVLRVIKKVPHNDNHDIMLLKLEKAITNQKYLAPLADDDACKKKPEEDKDVEVAGHAKVDKNDKSVMGPPWELQCVTMKVSKCNMNMRFKTYRFDKSIDNWICYKGDNKGTCRGDSGGGVIYEGKLRGVHVAGGKIGCTKCCFSMDVCKYKQWIEDNTK